MVIDARYLNNLPLTGVTAPSPSAKINVSSSFLSAFQEVMAAGPVRSQGTLIDASLKKEVKLAVPTLLQGHNACGPTALSMVLNYYGVSSVKFDSCTVGSSPRRLIEAAEKKGMTVRQENNGTIEDLTALLDMGIPPVILGINGGKKGNEVFTPGNFLKNAERAHWMTVTGYKTDDRGAVTYLYVNNPATGSTQAYSKENFLKFWNDNIVPGGNRYYLAAAPQSGTSHSFQLAALKRYLPQDKISSTFKATLEAVHKLEEAFYASEKAADKVADKAKDAWDEVKSWFS